MRTLRLVLTSLSFMLCLTSPSLAATLEWDRNAEPDMKEYQIWACFTPSCVLVKSASTLQPGTITQPAVGVTPRYVIDLVGMEGSLAVSARDLAMNESGLSVPVNFDQRAPTVPSNPRLTP